MTSHSNNPVCFYTPALAPKSYCDENDNISININECIWDNNYAAGNVYSLDETSRSYVLYSCTGSKASPFFNRQSADLIHVSQKVTCNIEAEEDRYYKEAFQSTILNNVGGEGTEQDSLARVIEEIFKVSNLDYDLFSRLLKEMLVAYEHDALKIIEDIVRNLRKNILDDEQFVKWSLKLYDDLSIPFQYPSGSERASSILHVMGGEACVEISAAVPVLRRGVYAPSTLETLRKDYPELFEKTVIESPRLFKKISENKPEWITRDLAIRAVETNGALYQYLRSPFNKDSFIAELAVRGDGMMLFYVYLFGFKGENWIEMAIRQNPKVVHFLHERPITHQRFPPPIAVDDLLPYYRMAVSIDGMAMKETWQKYRTPSLVGIAMANNRAAMIYDPAVLGSPKPQDIACVLEILREQPDLYRDILDQSYSSSMLYKHPLILDFVLKDPRNIPLILKHKYLFPREIVLTILRKDGMAIRHIPENERTPELMSAALEGDPAALIYDPSVFRSPTPEINSCLRSIIIERPSLFREIVGRSSIWQDPEIMEQALKDTSNIRLILEQPDICRQTVLAALSVNGIYLKHVKDIEHTKDPEIIETSLKSNPYAINFVHPSQRYRPVWHRFLREDPQTRYLTELPRFATFGRFWTYSDFMKMAGDRADLEERIRNDPVSPMHPQKPIALILGAQFDPSGVLKFNSMHRLLKEGFQVAYYEIATAKEFARVINFYLPLLTQGDGILVYAHGDTYSIFLSNKGDVINVAGAEYNFGQWLPKNEIKPGVILGLSGCSNAAGGHKDQNAMTMMYNIFDKKWHVYAVDRIHGGYVIVKDGKLKSVGNFNGNTYHMFPEDGGVEVIPPAPIRTGSTLLKDYIDARLKRFNKP